jgi:hypothetical protein
MLKVAYEIFSGIMTKLKEVINLIISVMEKRGIPRALQVVLLTGLILGVLYTFIVPPWWHYDEAGHFEQAWLIANKYHLPGADEYDAEVRRKIAESMIEHKWYSIRSAKLPDLSNNPVSIGVLQNSGPRLYYIYSALPLQFVKGTDMATQCRAVRFGSVLLFLGFLVICWKLMEEIVPTGHPLQWMVPTFAVLLPGLLDTMTAINDDVGAVFVFSLFLLYSVRVIKKGLSISNLAGLLFALLLCYLTKSTTWFAFILTPLVILQGILKQRLIWLTWALIIVGTLVGVLAAFSWGDALYWYRVSSQESSTRVIRTDAPHGNAAFQIDSSITQAGQFINSDAFYKLRGKTLTLGAWMWADQPIEVDFPMMAVANFDDVNRTQLQILNSEHVQTSTQPTFHKVTFTVPDIAVRGWLYLSPKYDLAQQSENSMIYYDGLVLAYGNFSETPPTFENRNASAGIWDGKEFTNLLRNGSAELSGPRVRPWVDIYTQFIPNAGGRISIILDALIDQQGTSWYFRSAFSSMYQTFWSKFAAGKVFLLSFYAYEILQYLTLLAIFGVLLRFFMGWKSLPWDVALPFALSVLFMWGSTFLRGTPELAHVTNVIPWARYAFPSIIPTSLFICAGWLTVAKVLKKFGFNDIYFYYSFLALMIALNVFTALSLDSYFSGQSRTTFDNLFLITLFAMFCAVALGSKLIQKNTQP